MNAVGWLTAALALFIALILTLLPLPESLAMARPAFVPLILAYLCLSTPQRFGLLWAAALGLTLDVAHATILGQHMLSLSLLMYGVVKLRGSIVLFPAWQQALVLAPLWFAYEGLLLWIDGLAGQSIEPSWRWLAATSTSLLWPLVTAIFALLERDPHHGD